MQLADQPADYYLAAVHEAHSHEGLGAQGADVRVVVRELLEAGLVHRVTTRQDVDRLDGLKQELIAHLHWKNGWLVGVIGATMGGTARGLAGAAMGF